MIDIRRYMTLVLDRAYRPVYILPGETSVALLLDNGKGVKADVLEPHRDRCGKPIMLHGGRGQIVCQLPSVILLRDHVLTFADRKLALNARSVFERDNFRCQYCNESGSVYDLTKDHVVPRSQGGESVWENVVTACRSCNFQKADRSLADMREETCHNGRPFRLIKTPVAPQRPGSGRYVRKVMSNTRRYLPWLAYIPGWRSAAQRMGATDLIKQFKQYEKETMGVEDVPCLEEDNGAK